MIPFFLYLPSPTTAIYRVYWLLLRQFCCWHLMRFTRFIIYFQRASVCIFYGLWLNYYISLLFGMGIAQYFHLFAHFVYAIFITSPLVFLFNFHYQFTLPQVPLKPKAHNGQQSRKSPFPQASASQNSLLDKRARKLAQCPYRIQKNPKQKTNNIQNRPITNITIPGLEMYNQQTERIRNRIEQHGNPAEIEQLCLDSIEIGTFTAPVCAELAKCTNLLFLTLNHCEITSLANFPVLPTVLALEIIGNMVKGSDLQYIGHCQNIQELALDQNQIQKIEDLAALNGLLRLEHLEIRGNPLCSIENYRAKIFELIPKLEIVDCQDVFGDDGVMFGSETESEGSNENEQEQEKQEDQDNSDQQFGDKGGHKYWGI